LILPDIPSLSGRSVSEFVERHLCRPLVAHKSHAAGHQLVVILDVADPCAKVDVVGTSRAATSKNSFCTDSLLEYFVLISRFQPNETRLKLTLVGGNQCKLKVGREKL
jgi:hypothetical protein